MSRPDETPDPLAPPADADSPGPSAPRVLPRLGGFRGFLQAYAWVIAKNVAGWLMILLAFPVGLAVPGPGGIPIFLVGFALITFPGKRGLTARVFRGLPIPTRGATPHLISFVTAMVLPVLVALVVRGRFPSLLDNKVFGWPYVIAPAVLSMALAYAVGLVGIRLANVAIRFMPRVRRTVRPMMRRRGIDLLPPRRRRRLRVSDATAVDHEIIEIDPSYGKAASSVWKRIKPWIRRILGLALMALIFFYMVKPVRGRWGEVSQRILDYELWRFVLAAAMFAAFLFFFRCLIWLKMIKGFGYRIPLAAGTRIWSTGELARYLPGTIWQVLGRVYLIKPYGVPASVCSTTQILDIATFLLANIVIGLSCVLWFFSKAEPAMKPYLWGAICLVPLLGLGLHPKVFYGIANRVMKRMGKAGFSTRLRGKKLTKYFVTYLVALLIQSAAIWVLLGDALHIKADHWWQLAGPYCLAWSAGFVVGWWSPGGLGVREFVFVGLLQLTLGKQSREMFPDEASLLGFLLFCSVLLRLWTITGELLVAGVAYAMDYKGALNHPDAPGRVALPTGATTLPSGTDAGASSSATERPASLSRPVSST